MPTKKSAAPKGRKRATTKKAAPKLGQLKVRRQQDYAAKAGDTLKSVADKFKVPVNFLARANSLDATHPEATRLTPGLTLRIPEVRFNPAGGAVDGWVEIAPIWYQKNPKFGEDRIIVAKLKRATVTK